jgi:hypothetical protein
MPDTFKATAYHERTRESEAVHAEQSCADSEYRYPVINLELLMHIAVEIKFIITDLVAKFADICFCFEE